MDYFGCSLWTELMMNNVDWNSSLNLPLDEDDEFIPDKGGWDVIFQRLNYMVEESGLKGKMGGCFHTSSDIPRVLQTTGLDVEFNQSLTAHARENAFEFGMHSTFGKPDLVCQGNFYNVLKKDLELCSILGGTSIVEHSLIPTKKGDFHLKHMVDELTSDNIVDLMLKYPKIALCWENLGNPWEQFSSPHRINMLLDALLDKFKEMGRPELIKNHLLCLDTGHLLLATNKSRKIKKEIVDSLPEFAKRLKVFHIHANNGKKDNHIIPFSLEFFDHPTRKNINIKKFLKNSEIVMDWLKICDENKGMDGRHIHLEALRMPFSLNQVTEFGKKYVEKILF